LSLYGEDENVLYAQWFYKSQDNIFPYAKTVLQQQRNRIGELNLMAQINLNTLSAILCFKSSLAIKLTFGTSCSRKEKSPCF
jgi:hypothetical protein